MNVLCISGKIFRIKFLTQNGERVTFGNDDDRQRLNTDGAYMKPPTPPVVEERKEELVAEAYANGVYFLFIQQ